MEEKEERILIAVRHTSKELNMSFTDMFKEYTRQEAIGRMAKAICSCDCDYLCSDYSCYDDPKACKCLIEHAGYDKLAEATLDALLGEK